MTKLRRNEFFAREFTKLNPAQRRAVETIDGPVMVVAGPGTGKTQVIAMRIAQILHTTQLNPRNILALTFTEAGVTAMQKRLEKIIGPEAYQVTVSTFHGFANEVIATFPYVFGFAVEATMVSDLERLQIIHRILERDSKLIALRPLRSPTFHTKAVADAIRKAKQENISPAELKKHARKEYEVTLDSKRVTASQRQSATRQRKIINELASVYATYQEDLKKRHLYDYEDMIAFAQQALAKEADVRAYYQERYQYILVDEYQDTNNAQNALVSTLAEFFPNPNLCVVGDDKQAIYRFQGASVANMLYFTKKYPQLKIIVLEENYRSAPPILAVAATSISNNRHQLTNYLDIVKTNLIATREGKQCELKLVSTPDEPSQFAWVADRIEERVKKGVKTEDIAVLFRTNDEVRRFRQFSLRRGINIAGTESMDLVAEPEVRQLITLLQAVNDPADRRYIALALAIAAPLSPVTMARFGHELDRHKTFDAARGAIKLEPGEGKRLDTALEKITNWAASKEKLPLEELCVRIVCESEITKSLAPRPDALERLELLKAMLDEVRRFAQQHPFSTLADFLERMKLLGNYRLPLTVNRLTPMREGVFASTVHGAKGLEFDTVFMANVSTKSWHDRIRRQIIKLPSNLVGLEAWEETPTEDERRLFYVGLTRAKNCLYFSYPLMDQDGRELLKSQFVSEVDGRLSEETVRFDNKAAMEVVRTTITTPTSIVLQEQERRVIREMITQSPFAYTDYKTYKLCPKQYLLNSLLRFPTKPEPRLIYGSILHRSLELFYKQYRAQKRLPNSSALLGYLDQAARQTAEFQGKRAVVAQSKELLQAYHQHIGESPIIPVGVEYSLTGHHVLLEDIWLTGKLDRIDPIDPIGRTVKVIDYKTGAQARTRNQIEGRTKAEDGTLREQLVFYALLTRLDRNFPYVATEFALKFLDDKHTFREESFKVSTEETEKLATDVAATYRKILSQKEFTHTREEFDRGCELCEVFEILA